MGQTTLRIILHPEEEGGFTVTVPSLLGCVTFGETVSAAKSNATEAVALYVEDLKANGESVPDDAGSLEYFQTIDIPDL